VRVRKGDVVWHSAFFELKGAGVVVATFMDGGYIWAVVRWRGCVLEILEPMMLTRAEREPLPLPISGGVQ
jgi:hypothetical protein